MTTDPTQHDSESDEDLERKLREAVDERETARPAAARLPTSVTIEGYDIIRELHRGEPTVDSLTSLDVPPYRST